MTDSLEKKLLIVEDSSFIGKVMEMSFAKLGYTCQWAVDPLQAFEMLKTFTPDIILSDYEMPGMNGFEFRQKLLQNDEWKDIPFVFLTSHSDEALVLKGLHLSALDYIIKGTPYPIIASKLDNILNSLHHEHERSVEELKKAAEMLKVKSIPTKEPGIKGFKVRFWNQSYQDYPGGDFIDFIKVDERHTFLFIGDIMGKKWQAWFFTFGYLSYIRSAIRLCILDGTLSCKDIMAKINRVVCEDEGLKDILSSLSLILVDSEAKTLCYTGAGDLPLIHYNAGSDSITTIHSSGLLLGLMEDGMFDEQHIELSPGDKILLFTDGLTDLLIDGNKKSSFPLLVQRFSPLLKKTESFEAIKLGLITDLSGGHQIDDASLIFIEKEK